MNVFISKNDTQQSNAHFVGSSNNKLTTEKKENQKQTQSKTIFAGNLNTGVQDQIAEKKVQAQKQAMKLKLDQLTSDNEVDDTIKKCSDNSETCKAEAAVAQENIKNIKDAKNQLKDAYGINDDSVEQKNLDLLEKSMDPTKTLTDDEEKQLANMGSLTDYQKTALRYDTMQSVFEGRLKDAKAGVENSQKSVESIKQSLLKDHPMVDAQNQAAEIMDNASKEAVGMLLTQGKENVDDKLEKQKEDADKKAEEDQEQEDKLDKIKEDKAEKEQASDQSDSVSQSDQSDASKEVAKDSNDDNNDSNKNLQESDAKADKIVTELKSFIDKNNILEEDAKGIAVDQTM